MSEPTQVVEHRIAKQSSGEGGLLFQRTVAFVSVRDAHGQLMSLVKACRVRLSGREFALLRTLLMRPGALLSRQELEERIYGLNE